jgi:ABC-type nitrate/sulfonate/bicarbonate transport system permease component
VNTFETAVDASIAVEQPAAQPADHPLRRFYHAHERPILGWTAVVTFLVLWQWAGSTGVVNPMFSSTPVDVWKAFIKLAQGELLTDFLVSGQEFLWGFGLAVIVGVPLGVLMGWYRPLDFILDPFVSFMYATPRVALLPLMIIWLGIGLQSKVAFVFLGAVFSILINTVTGVKNLDANLLRAARAFCATDLQIFRTIALPGSVPYILGGIRLGLGHALIGVVVGELYGAEKGLGRMIAVAGNTFQTDKVFVGVIIIAAGGVLISMLFQRIENHFQSWRPVR